MICGQQRRHRRPVPDAIQLRLDPAGWRRIGRAGTTGDRETTTNVDALVVFNASKFNYDFPKTSLDFTRHGLPSLNDFGRVRLNANLSYSRELVKDFNLTFSGYNYDNRPPTAGASKNDVGFSLSLGWTF